MNSITREPYCGHSTSIDAKDTQGPAPTIKLESALKKAPEHAVFAVMTAKDLAESSLRDFCRSSGNVYLSVRRLDDHDVHYVKKRVVECQRCSNLRVVSLGLAAVATLAYTAPQVLNSNPSGVVTVLFAAALAAMPPVLIDNLRLVKKLVKKSRTSAALEAAE